jgi:hypothetical protein
MWPVRARCPPSPTGFGGRALDSFAALTTTAGRRQPETGALTAMLGKVVDVELTVTVELPRWAVVWFESGSRGTSSRDGLDTTPDRRLRPRWPPGFRSSSRPGVRRSSSTFNSHASGGGVKSQMSRSSRQGRRETPPSPPAPNPPNPASYSAPKNAPTDEHSTATLSRNKGNRRLAG